MSLSATAGLLVYLGLYRADHVARSAALFVLAWSALSFGFLLISRLVFKRWYQRAISSAPSAAESYLAEVGQEFMMGQWPRFLGGPTTQMRVLWPSPQHVNVRMERVLGGLKESVVFHRRTALEHVEREFVLEDSLEFFRWTVSRRVRAALLVLPHRGKLRDLPDFLSQSAGEVDASPSGQPSGERLELRRYVPGDPLRLVLWRVYARTRTLVVRTPEHAIEPELCMGAYLMTGHGDEAAAAALRVAIEEGRLGDTFAVGADGVDFVAWNRADALQVVARSGVARPQHANDNNESPGLASFAAQLPKEMALLVCVSAADLTWLPRVLRELQTVHRSKVVLLAADRFAAQDDEVLQRHWGKRLRQGLRMQYAVETQVADSSAPVLLERLADAVAALRRAGVRVYFVERQSGRVFA